MKQMKKTMTILMLFAMLLSTCGIMASAFHVAVETEPVGPVSILEMGSDTVAPQRFERCEHCQNGKVNYAKTEFGSWSTVDFIDCPHGDSTVKDWKQERSVTKFYECDTCPYCYQRRSFETRIVCKSKYN